MPVQTLTGSTSNNLYCHIYNRGINDNKIFRDEEDYNIFLNFLKEYITSPTDSGSSKTVFKIRGQAFYGTPHQPKNYNGKIELVAYGLSPNSFHLLVTLKHKEFVQSLIRSLCTRYSIYFNKKYHRTGSLFQGPYKSILLKEEVCILYLTRYLHTQKYSSFQEYLGTKHSDWVKPKSILLYFDTLNSSLKSKFGDYKHFVENYKPNTDEDEVLQKIILEDKAKNVEHINIQSAETLKQDLPKKDIAGNKTKPRILELIVINTIFFFLVTLGISNIKAPTNIQYNLINFPGIEKLVARVDNPVAISNVLGIKTESNNIKDNNNIKNISINIIDGLENVNIYKDKNLNSEIIASAKKGASFKFISKEDDWVQIKLPNDLSGFVLIKYTNLEGGIK